MDEEEGHLGSFVGHSLPGELVEGEDVDADAEQEQDGENYPLINRALIVAALVNLARVSQGISAGIVSGDV